MFFVTIYTVDLSLLSITKHLDRHNSDHNIFTSIRMLKKHINKILKVRQREYVRLSRKVESTESGIFLKQNLKEKTLYTTRLSRKHL